MKNIILIGFMGCGKTSVGKRLSQALHCNFLDTDELIEKEQGRTIREIFAADGEAAFREMETECLRRLLESEKEAFVLSVGGGLPVKEGNRRLLKKLGNVFLLRVTSETVYMRLRNDKTRPLLQDRNPRGRIQDLMSARKQFYEDAATFAIEADERTFEELVEEIIRINEEEMA